MTSFAITRAYQQSFESHPHTTLAVTGGFFNALGDFVAQISQIVVSYPSMYSETVNY
jgi:protein Mpv17